MTGRSRAEKQDGPPPTSVSLSMTGTPSSNGYMANADRGLRRRATRQPSIASSRSLAKRRSIVISSAWTDTCSFPPAAALRISKNERDAAHRAGLADVRLVDAAPIPGYNTGSALLFPNQGQFHPIKYLAGVAKAIERMGGRIHTRTHIESIKGGENPSAKVQAGPTIRANCMVVATNTPVNDWVTIHTKQAPYRSM